MTVGWGPRSRGHLPGLGWGREKGRTDLEPGSVDDSFKRGRTGVGSEGLGSGAGWDAFESKVFIGHPGGGTWRAAGATCGLERDPAVVSA